MITLTKPCDFSDYMTLLINFDRKGTTILALIATRLNSGGKRIIQCTDARINEIFESQQHGHIEAALL